jgi:hypothetical protein
MNPKNVEVLMDRWMNDPAFREDLRTNPEQAAESAGVTLNEDEMAALKSVDWSLSDDELTQRVTKSGFTIANGPGAGTYVDMGNSGIGSMGWGITGSG